METAATGYWLIPGHDVFDRDALDARRDHLVARDYGEVDAVLSAAQLRYQVGHDAVLEGYIQTLVLVVAFIECQVERRELHVRDIAQGDCDLSWGSRRPAAVGAGVVWQRALAGARRSA